MKLKKKMWRIRLPLMRDSKGVCFMLTGCYRDIIKVSGSCLSDSGWRNNHIVASCDTLTAALFKDEPSYRGIGFLAIGTGDSKWDHTDTAASSDVLHLTNEVLRLKLDKKSLFYVNESGGEASHPTNRLQVTCSIRIDVIPELSKIKMLPLREFGLFGGNATEEKNSGQMIDYVIHPRIDLTPGIRLNRTIELRFANATHVAPVPVVVSGTGKLVLLPLRAIDGIGLKYDSDLAAAGVSTIEDLAAIDPESYKGAIPIARLREFRSKAAFSTRLRIDAYTLAPFDSLSVEDFIKTPVDELAAAAPAGLSKKQIREQQLELALLESSFNTSRLKTLFIKGLLP